MPRAVCVVVSLWFLAAGGWVSWCEPLSAPAERSPDYVEPAREWIVPRSAALKSLVADATPHIQLPPLSETERSGFEDLSSTQFQSRRAKIGLTRPVEVSGPGAGKAVSGDLVVGPTETVWSLRIRSEDARGIRIHFEDFRIPEGASVMVYDARDWKNQEGPFEGEGPIGSGEFYSATLFTDEVVIEYVTPDAEGAAVGVPFRITGVVHLVKKTETGDKGGQDCSVDVACFNPTTYEYKNAIGRMAFMDGGEAFTCSGCLLTDLDPDSFIPFFLSANHCFNNQAAANTLEVYWNYERSSCNGNAPSLGSLQRNVGAQILATRDLSVSDFLLLRLNQRAPAGLFFLGWSAGTTFIGASVHSIHHPEGTPKEIAFGQVVNDTDVGGINEANYWQVAWSDGSTRGGSSGAPLIVGDGTVIGALSGGVGTCPNPSARDVFGRFAVSFPFISSALGNPSPTVLFDYAVNWRDTGNTPQNLVGYLRIFHPPN